MKQNKRIFERCDTKAHHSPCTRREWYKRQWKQLNKEKWNERTHMYIISTYNHWLDIDCTVSAGAVNIQSSYKL